jgi:DNA-binding CsgD family transcriptional regulator
MECHRCNIGQRLAAGDAALLGAAYESTPCASCDGNPSSIGETFEYDEGRGRAELPGVGESACGEAVLPVSCLGVLVRMLLELTREDLEAVQLRWLGMSCDEIAKRLGISANAVTKRLGHAKAKHPCLGAVLPRYVARNRGGLKFPGVG